MNLNSNSLNASTEYKYFLVPKLLQIQEYIEINVDNASNIFFLDDKEKENRDYFSSKKKEPTNQDNL